MHRLVVRLETLLVFGVPALILIVTGVGFLVAALYIALANALGPAGAALTTGVICFAVAGLLALIGWLVLRALRPRRKRPGHSADGMTMAMAAGEAMGGDLRSLAKQHRFGLVGGALAAGFVVGVSPKVRRLLLNFLRDG